MPDLDDRLAGLARYAERTARLESAPSIRVRADRRRRRRYTAAAALGVALAVALGTGIAIAQPDHPRRAPLPPAGPTSAPPSAGLETPRPTPSFAAQAADEKQTGLKYQRAYRLVPMETGVVGVNPATGLGLAPDGRFQVRWSGATATFIVAQMTEGDPQWIIRLEENGLSRCLSVRLDSTLGLARCAPSDARQRFQFLRGAVDRTRGVPAYRIVNVDRPPVRWLTWDPDAERLTMSAETSGAFVTGWVFVDEGPSTQGR